MPSGKKRQSRDRYKPKEVNLVTARSAAYADVAALSRGQSAEKYAKTRAKRARNKVLSTAFGIVMIAALAAIATTVGVYKLILEPHFNANIQTRPGEASMTDFTNEIYEDLFEAPDDPMDPFFILLIGVDNEGINDLPRSDTLILVYVDPGQRKVAMISIPRDLYVPIAGYGKTKINAAYAYGEMEHNEYLAGRRERDNSGPALCIRTVQELCGIEIAYFAEVNFGSFIQLVDKLGGVYVDVPVPISDPEAGPSVLSAGPQVLNGEQALTFVRSRRFVIGDYQRQANQRTFLQALAKQILQGDPASIYKSVDSLTEMIYSNTSMSVLVDLAMAFQGLQETDIYTYTVPSHPDFFDEISYLILEENNWRGLIVSVANGEFPDAIDYGLTIDHMGKAPEEYQPGDATAVNRGGILSFEQCQGFVVDVRNGWGTKGAATAVSDMLNLVGYQQGAVGNTNSFVYQETLVIYKDEADRPAAEDIVMRLGYGRVIPSAGRYQFEGNILVIVGGDFPH